MEKIIEAILKAGFPAVIERVCDADRNSVLRQVITLELAEKMASASEVRLDEAAG